LLFVLPSLPPPHLYFFFTPSSISELYSLSLHDALPISTICIVSLSCPKFVMYLPIGSSFGNSMRAAASLITQTRAEVGVINEARSEEHTSELQSLRHLVCRLLLEKKNKSNKISDITE